MARLPWYIFFFPSEYAFILLKKNEHLCGYCLTTSGRVMYRSNFLVQLLILKSCLCFR